METYDYVIIGGGIIGTAVARELASRKAGRILLLEKEDHPGAHASGRNSGVIHSGINQKPGSLKATMCVKGSRLLRDFCRRRGVPMNECGTLVVARDERDQKTLQQMLEMGRACGVEGLEILDAVKLREREPSALGISALLSPSGAAVDSLKLLETLVEEARSQGVDYRLNHPVGTIEENILHAGGHSFRAGHIINCAGLYADRMAHQMGVGLGYRIIPFRGEYMEVRNCPVNSMIYQTPDLRFPFLSVHLTRETDGRVLAGPTATLAFGRESYDKQFNPAESFEMFLNGAFWKLILSREFLRVCLKNLKISFSRRAFFTEIQKIAQNVSFGDIRPARAGIRAQMIDPQGRFVNDLLVERGPHSTHVLNAVSPGMTCSLAFAEYVVNEYVLGAKE